MTILNGSFKVETGIQKDEDPIHRSTDKSFQGVR